MQSSGSSFIPKRPTQGKVAAKSYRKVYILSYISYLVFFTVLLAVGGIFFYKLSLQSQLTNLQTELVAQKDSFNQAQLDRVRNLDVRIDTAQELIDNHASIMTIFRALEGTVADPVQLLSFHYNRTENINTPRLTLSAQAEEFDAIIFQKEVLSNFPVTDGFDTVEVSLETQPIDPEQLELGVEEMVHVTLDTNLGMSDINYTGQNITLPVSDEFGQDTVIDDFDVEIVDGVFSEAELSEAVDAFDGEGEVIEEVIFPEEADIETLPSAGNF